MERDNTKVSEWFEYEISTHTLTWSVTGKQYMSVQPVRISTHTLTWSVTGDTFPTYCPLCDFNSHAHVERDPELSKAGEMP